LTIAQIRNPNDANYPGEGAVVEILNAYVTAVRPDSGGSRGFYIQDDATANFSGVFISPVRILRAYR